MKQIFLDTETTGLSPQDGDRVVEIAAIAYEDRHRLPTTSGGEYHQYINPEQEMPPTAYQVHGISDEFLADKPVFADIADAFIDYIRGNELIMHNAEFDCNFLNSELKRLGKPSLESITASINCSLQWSRENNAGGGGHSLNALCRFYGISLEERALHSALVDAKLLGEVYFRMRQRQIEINMTPTAVHLNISKENITIPRRHPTAEERGAHDAMLAQMEETAETPPLYKTYTR